MTHWTPEQITNLATAVGNGLGQIVAILAGLVVVIKLLRNNREGNEKLADSTPSDIVHKMLDNATAASTPTSTTQGSVTFPENSETDMYISSQEKSAVAASSGSETPTPVTGTTTNETGE